MDLHHFHRMHFSTSSSSSSSTTSSPRGGSSSSHRPLHRAIQRRVEQFEGHTLLAEQSEPTTEFNWPDLLIGPTIGKGTYSRVYRVHMKRSNPGATVSAALLHSPSSSLPSSSMTASSSSSSMPLGGPADVLDRAYAMKRLDPSLSHGWREHRTGSSDLAMETKLLERLRHPNIIRLHGIKRGNLGQNLEDGTFFCLLDLLGETLDQRLTRWRLEEKEWLGKKQRLRNLGGSLIGGVGGNGNSSRGRGGARSSSGSGGGGVFQKVKSRLTGFAGIEAKQLQQAQLQQKRLLHRIERAALGIAQGMEYLHEQGIIFRDLKPQNVGFDAIDDTVKIFDFGIARELRQSAKMGMSLGFAGTPRYMAREIGEGRKDYDFSADVYSFGILLWELCTLQKPFERMTSLDDYHHTVVENDLRPSIKAATKAGAPPELVDLMELCWLTDASRRPTFNQILCTLHAILRRYSSILFANREDGQRKRVGMDGVELDEWKDVSDRTMKTVCSTSSSAGGESPSSSHPERMVRSGSHVAAGVAAAAAVVAAAPSKLQARNQPICVTVGGGGSDSNRSSFTSSSDGTAPLTATTSKGDDDRDEREMLRKTTLAILASQTTSAAADANSSRSSSNERRSAAVVETTDVPRKPSPPPVCRHSVGALSA